MVPWCPVSKYGFSSHAWRFLSRKGVRETEIEAERGTEVELGRAELRKVRNSRSGGQKAHQTLVWLG